MLKLRLMGTLALALLLGGCETFDAVVEKTSELVEDTTQLVKRSLPSDSLSWPSGEGVRTFTIDDDASEVVIRVYRAGRLSKFGHNHAIQPSGLKGRAAVTEEFADSAFELQSPLSGWIVDDADLRASLGEDFESKPSKSDIEGTRGNMMGPKGLEAEKFPVLSISGNVELEGKAQVLNAHVALHGVTQELRIPVSLVISGSEMRVIGEFSVKQSDFGVEPLSLLFGALRVRDTVDIRFSIVLRE